MITSLTLSPNYALGYRETQHKLSAIGCHRERPVLVLGNWRAVGAVVGGAVTFLGALQANCSVCLLPSFTPQTCLPAGTDHDNDSYEFWHLDLPVDPALGELPETARQHPTAYRSTHPCLSFVALGNQAAAVLAEQTLADPFSPVRWVAQQGGLLVLLGDQPEQTCVASYAAQRAGHPATTTFAIQHDKIVLVENIPTPYNWRGGFSQALSPLATQTMYGRTVLYGYPLCQFIMAAETLYGRQKAHHT